MLTDARTLADGTVLATELCIIGGGAAGLAIALELRDSGVSICVLESGGLRHDSRTQALYEGVVEGFPYDLTGSRTRFLGGSSNCWSGFCRPFEAHHFLSRDWVPESGWPLTRDDLDPYYQRAHALLGIDPAYYSFARAVSGPAAGAAGGSDTAQYEIVDGDVVTSISQLNLARRRMGKAFGAALAAAPNLSVYLHANVLCLDTDPFAQTVTSAEVGCLDGKRFRVKANVFVLCTGGIENARVLLLSNRVQPAGLGNRYDLVGRYFMEHPTYVPAELTWPRPSAADAAYDINYALRRLTYAAEINLSPAAQKRERVLDAAAYIVPVYQSEHSPAVLALKDAYREGAWKASPLRRLVASGHLFTGGFDLALFVFGYWFRARRLIRGHELRIHLEQCPNRDSRVTLSRERDALGLPKVALDWRLTELDRHSLQRTQAVIAAALGRLRGAELKPLEQVSTADSQPLPGWIWHHVGTTRMHHDPKRGVVDVHGRVHGMNNLYIAGSSTFPTAGNHTPTLTLLALAIRLADRLRQVMKESLPAEITPVCSEAGPASGFAVPMPAPSSEMRARAQRH